MYFVPRECFISEWHCKAFFDYIGAQIWARLHPRPVEEHWTLLDPSSVCSLSTVVEILEVDRRFIPFHFMTWHYIALQRWLFLKIDFFIFQSRHSDSLALMYIVQGDYDRACYYAGNYEHSFLAVSILSSACVWVLHHFVLYSLQWGHH